MALGDEIQAVQAGALQALELEVAGEVEAAGQLYVKVSSQLQYLLDVCVPHSQPDLVAVCRGLLETYACRMQALKVRSLQQQQHEQQQQLPDEPLASQHPGHWLHVEAAMLEQAAAYYDNTSAASTSDGTPFMMDPHMNANARLVACAAGSGGATVVQQPPHGSWDGGGGSGGAAPAGFDEEAGGAAKLELLRQCRREVSGTLDDVVGLESIKDELEEAVFMPLKHPHLFKGICKPPRHFLLYGPPGTGKTLLVEKMAAEAGFTLLALSPSNILSKWSGESEKALQTAFDVARAMAPSVVFLDEVDALGQARSSGGEDPSARRLLTELLLQMNGLGGEEGVYVFAATNRMADCDPALIRRFDRRIEVPVPGAAARAAFLSSMLSRPEIDSQLSEPEVQALAAATQGFSGSDMACLCRQAAMVPVRELFERSRGAGKRRRLALAEACKGRVGGGEGALGVEGADGDVGGGPAEGARGVTVVRKLVVGDFEAALRKIRPAAADAADGGAGVGAGSSSAGGSMVNV